MGRPFNGPRAFFFQLNAVAESMPWLQWGESCRRARNRIVAPAPIPHGLPEIGAGIACIMSAKSSLPIFGCALKRTLARVDHRARHFRNDLGLLSWFTSTLKVSRISAMISTWKALRSGADRAHPLADQRPHLVGKCADGAAKLGFAGNHVVGGAGVIWVIDSTADFRGSTLRLTMVCSACPSVIAITTASFERSGIAPCAP